MAGIGLELHLVVRSDNTTVAWWAMSDEGEWPGVAAVGAA
jgi:hypothetical protein